MRRWAQALVALVLWAALTGTGVAIVAASWSGGGTAIGLATAGAVLLVFAVVLAASWEGE